MLATSSLLFALAILTAFARLTSQRRSLRRIRAEWGSPVQKSRKIDRIAHYHFSRRQVLSSADGSLDDGTWRDLDLDAVFVLIDRTESTLGQQALYDRLRSERPEQSVAEFDGLATALAETEKRERVQAALARLQDPQGYDLWWMAAPDGIVTPDWMGVFPLLTAATVAALTVGFGWLHIVPAVLGTVVVCTVIHYFTDPVLEQLTAGFRQIAPLVRAMEAVARAKDARLSPYVGDLEESAACLRSLKRLSQWMSDDPLMLPLMPRHFRDW